MSFVDALERELRARHVPADRRRRIVTELADHLRCEPASEGRLGDPADLAATFASELAADGARRGAREAFLALTVAAAALVAGQLALGAAGGSPGFENGHSLVLALPALLGIVVGPQVALAAGSLAAIRALRRRGASALPDAEVALVNRRSYVGLAGGLATCAGLLLYVANFSARLAPWWLWMQAGLAVAASAALVVAAVRIRRSGAIVAGVGGPAGGFAEDLPVLRGLSERPWRLCAVAALGVATATTLGVGHAEGSLAEGLERGVFEALLVVAAFAALGRLVGARAGDD